MEAYEMVMSPDAGVALVNAMAHSMYAMAELIGGQRTGYNVMMRDEFDKRDLYQWWQARIVMSLTNGARKKEEVKQRMNDLKVIEWYPLMLYSVGMRLLPSDFSGAAVRAGLAGLAASVHYARTALLHMPGSTFVLQSLSPAIPVVQSAAALYISGLYLDAVKDTNLLIKRHWLELDLSFASMVNDTEARLLQRARAAAKERNDTWIPHRRTTILRCPVELSDHLLRRLFATADANATTPEQRETASQLLNDTVLHSVNATFDFAERANSTVPLDRESLDGADLLRNATITEPQPPAEAEDSAAAAVLAERAANPGWSNTLSSSLPSWMTWGQVGATVAADTKERVWDQLIWRSFSDLSGVVNNWLVPCWYESDLASLDETKLLTTCLSLREYCERNTHATTWYSLALTLALLSGISGYYFTACQRKRLRERRREQHQERQTAASERQVELQERQVELQEQQLAATEEVTQHLQRVMPALSKFAMLAEGVEDRRRQNLLTEDEVKLVQRDGMHTLMKKVQRHSPDRAWEHRPSSVRIEVLPDEEEVRPELTRPNPLTGRKSRIPSTEVCTRLIRYLFRASDDFHERLSGFPGLRVLPREFSAQPNRIATQQQRKTREFILVLALLYGN